MAIPSIYLNLEDDVAKILQRVKREKASSVVLVCPKRCFLFSDSINLRLLKKQTDLLGKEVFILTMDEKGQLYAQEAGFKLKFLPKGSGNRGLSDIKFSKKHVPDEEDALEPAPVAAVPFAAAAVNEIKNLAGKLMPGSEVKPRVKIAAPGVNTEQIFHTTKVETTDNIFPNEISESPEHPQSAKRMSRVITGFAALCLVVILLLAFVILPKATVVVYPKTEPITRDIEISMSANASAVDADKLIMPGVVVNETINVTDKFQSQGKKQVGNKASGTVKIYNFTHSPLNLKASTTTFVVGSKTYILLNDVNGLKPTTYTNSRTKEVDPASLGDSVEVAATDGGEDFNLPAGTRMEITNQVFGSKPQFLYAVTDSEITGGTTRYLSLISQSDLDAAKTQLQTEALAEINQKLQGQGEVLADKAYTMSITQFTTDSPLGAQTPSFQGTLQAQVTGMAFKKQDLSDLISKRISQTLASNKTLQVSQPDQTTYSAKSLDLTNQLAVLDVHFQGQAVFNVDLPDIAPELVGKSQGEVNEILQSKAEIDKVEITLAPAWQKNFPFFASKIKVIIGQE